MAIDELYYLKDSFELLFPGVQYNRLRSYEPWNQNVASGDEVFWSDLDGNFYVCEEDGTWDRRDTATMIDRVTYKTVTKKFHWSHGRIIESEIHKS